MITLQQIVQAARSFSAFFLISASQEEAKRFTRALAILEHGEPDDTPRPILCTPSRAYHTTDDLAQLISKQYIPLLKQRKAESFTGPQARKWVEDNIDLTDADNLLTGISSKRERWRGLLTQALNRCATTGVIYKQPGKTRTYFIRY